MNIFARSAAAVASSAVRLAAELGQGATSLLHAVADRIGTWARR